MGDRSEFNILHAVNEFYALMGIEAIAKTEPFRHSHERWNRDFTEYRERYVKQFANAVYDYTVLATAGEMRHAKRQSNYCFPDFDSTFGSHGRVHVYRNMQYDPIQLLQCAVMIFDSENNTWGTGYGGQPWCNIAKAGLMKGRVPDVVFADHCVDLSHNSAVYFDKAGTGILELESDSNYKEFLTFKYEADPIDLIRRTGKSTHTEGLIERAVNLGILPVKCVQPYRKINPWGLFGSYSADKATELVLRYEPIEFGTETINGDIERTKNTYGQIETEQEEESENDENDTSNDDYISYASPELDYETSDNLRIAV